MQSTFDYGALDEILLANGTEESAVIAILQDIQERYRYLPREVFPYLAEKMRISEARIFSVATFYENFSLEAKGHFVIRICDGTACHVRKSIPILEFLRKELCLSEDKRTTDDLGFTVETVSCLGACGLAPVLTVNDKVYPAMTPEKAGELVRALREELAAKAEEEAR
ncbi:NADP-reducing hydrogenase subunit HndA [bioreactor metagenome]|uniref:NADP-reducing hydrogenase subunit HndA n=1 Tax=bioreactor metagenome TaxID=1076179 RepID=A0A645BNI8_9ZZZZ|nr:NAD(P)H-dependent oxidoreductase subunit E [Christensenella sp.]